MARVHQRLSQRTVETKKVPGYYADGAGLYLQIGKAGGKSWVFRYMLNGKAREMGLGPLRDISLAEARESAARNRKLLLEHVDPIEARYAARARKALELAKAKTFGECADAYILAHRRAWKNAKHADQWTNTLRTYAASLNALPVQNVDTGEVLKALEPIWEVKRETARRVRGRIEEILNWAKARGYRTGDNPAAWRGHLDQILPKFNRRRQVKHHEAIEVDAINAFMQALKAEEGIGARALEFTILTAARTGEVIGAKWEEVDLDVKLWTVPAARMKALREHRVPLSAAAVALLRGLPRLGEFVFPGRDGRRPISNMTMLRLLDRMGYEDLTVHGFRSTFRDWAAERTSFPSDVVEMALAHAISDETEAAYRRGDLFEKRRKLSEAWAAFVNTPNLGGKVSSINRAA